MGYCQSIKNKNNKTLGQSEIDKEGEKGKDENVQNDLNKDKNFNRNNCSEEKKSHKALTIEKDKTKKNSLNDNDENISNPIIKSSIIEDKLNKSRDKSKSTKKMSKNIDKKGKKDEFKDNFNNAKNYIPKNNIQIRINNKKEDHILQAIVRGGNYNNPFDKRNIVEDPFKFPFYYIGQIQALTQKGEIRLGTGTIISDYCVLTVAHNIIDNPDREYRKQIPLDNIIFCPLKTLDICCFGEIKVVDYYMPEEYLVKTESLIHDWAILKLEKPIGKYINRIFSSENNLYDHDCDKFEYKKVRIIGFPGEVEKNGRIYESEEGDIQKVNNEFSCNYIGYKLDTSGGQSGSPILVRDKNNLKIIGIHQRHQKDLKINVGLKLTSSINESIVKIIEKFENKENENINDIADLDSIYNNMGIVYDSISDFKKSIEYFEKSYLIRKVKYGENSLMTAEIYNNFGMVYDSLSNYNKSLEFYNKSLKIYSSFLGENHINIAITYNNIATVYSSMNEFKLSLDFYKKALNLYIDILGQEHQNTVKCYSNIGGVYESLSNSKLALEFYQKSLTLTEKLLGFDHIETADCYNSIGLVFDSLENYPLALEYYQKSLKILKNLVGENNVKTAILFNNMGLLQYRMKKYDIALEYYNRSLNIYVLLLNGEDHSFIASSYNNIGIIYKTLEDYDNALKYYDKSLKIREKIFGENHLDTADSYNNLGNIYFITNQLDQAILFYEKALKIKLRLLGDKNLKTAQAYQQLGNSYYNLSKGLIACDFYEKAINIYKSLNGNHDESIKSILMNIRLIEFNEQNNFH